MKYPRYQVGISSGEIKSDYLFFDFLLPVIVPSDFNGTFPHRLSDQSDVDSVDEIEIGSGIINPQLVSRLSKKRRNKILDYLTDSGSAVEVPVIEK